MRNCTLEDIDAVCLDLHQVEMYDVIHSYVNNSLALTVPSRGRCPQDGWLNCTRSESQETLDPDGVSYVLDKIHKNDNTPCI